MSFDFTVDGLDSLLDNLPTEANLGDGIGQGAHAWCGDVFTESQNRVPVDEGHLMESGYVGEPIVENGVVSVEMGYRAEYAIYVHEGVEGQRPPSPNWSWTQKVARGEEIEFTKPGTGTKFLEGPATEMEDALPEYIALGLSVALAS